MSTELMRASWSAKIEGQAPVAKLRTLTPMRMGNRPASPSGHGLSRIVLILVVLAHVSAFAALMTIAPAEPKVEAPAAPMMVSLVSNPAPEVVKPEPEPPKPQPVIKKPKPAPLPKVVEATSAPQAVQPEQTIVTEATEAPPVQPVAEKAVEVVEKPAPQEEPVVEKVEPPRFGAAYLHNPAPTYPPLSRRLNEQGKVILRVLVSANGGADTVQVETGSGSPRLDQAALDSVKKWRFIPAKRNNQPISAYVLVPVKFSLEG